MSRRIAVLIVLLAIGQASPLLVAQDSSNSETTPPPRARAANPATQAGRTSSAQTAGAPDQAAQESPSPSQQPQIIVNTPAAPSEPWSWHDEVAWGAGVILALFGYVGIMLALRTLKHIEQHVESGVDTAQAALESAHAALALAQAIANSERPWIVVTVEPFLTMENSFKVMASNRGRSPARLIGFEDQVRVAVDEKNLPKAPAFETADTGESVEPIVLLPGEATGIWSFNREDLPTICRTVDVQRQVERWRETLFVYGRIKYSEMNGANDKKLHETLWCCRYIHGDKKSALVMAGPPEYNKHS